MKAIGLMSGTSCDGVDAALVEIRGRHPDLFIKLLEFSSLAYSSSVRSRILQAARSGTVSEICHLNVLIGEWFAKAALKVIHKACLEPSSIAVIGSHGQTIHHLPNPIHERGIGTLRSTLQLGEPSVIAQRTGITTVGNFRARDMAAGGQGAPLAPFIHDLLFRNPKRSRLVVNLGGIGNITYLPRKGRRTAIQAFDTGPGNMVLDGLISHFTRGKRKFDKGGKIAKKGRVHHALLRKLLEHPFLRSPPPKTTGREDFGENFLARLLPDLKRFGLTQEDALATCSRFTALSVERARRWLSGPVDEVLVGGGGAFNHTLMADLTEAFSPLPVGTIETQGWLSKAIESVAFAAMAFQTIHGFPSNVPSATGSKEEVILGTIAPGHRMKRKSLLS